MTTPATVCTIQQVASAVMVHDISEMRGGATVLSVIWSRWGITFSTGVAPTSLLPYLAA